MTDRVPCCHGEIPASCCGPLAPLLPTSRPPSPCSSPGAEERTGFHQLGSGRGDSRLGSTTTACDRVLVSTGVEEDEDEDEDGCLKWGRAGFLRRGEPHEAGQGPGQLTHVRGRHRQLRRALRHFGARDGFASAFLLFTSPASSAEDNALPLWVCTQEQLRLRGGFGSARTLPAERFPH